MSKKTGRPLKFGTPQKLQAVIDKYFAKTDPDTLTVTGLALLVGSKQLLDDYQNRAEYKEIVTVAKLRVENAYELSLRKNGRAGDIFGLKNFGWSDKQSIEHTGLDGFADIIRLAAGAKK